MHEIICSLIHTLAEYLKDTLHVKNRKIQLSVCFILSFVFDHPLEKMSVTSTNVLTVTLDFRVKKLSNMDDFSQKCPEWMQLYVKNRRHAAMNRTCSKSLISLISP